MLEKITLGIIQELSKLRLNLNHLFFLERIIQGETVKDMPAAEYQALERKSLIFEGKVTENGTQFYEQLTSGNIGSAAEIKNKIISITADNLSHFEEWWGTRGKAGVYPATNHFEYRSRVFKGTQKKTIKKDECHVLFNKLVSSGEFTGKDIVEGTRNHILEAMQESLKTGQNQLSFIPNSERYLREKFFEPFIGMEKEQDKKLVNPKDLF